MLNNISALITPEIYNVLYNAGHLDEIAIIDGNNPIKNPNKIFFPIKNNHELLEEILKYYPLDDDLEHPVIVMEPLEADPADPAPWTSYTKVLEANDDTKSIELHTLNREAFNNRMDHAYAVIQTLDTRLYANIIIRKGVVLVLE